MSAAVVALVAVNLALAAPGSGAQEGGCEQPYKPMWMEYFGAGSLDQWGIESWPPHPHEKPFAAMTVDQPGGPQIIGGMPPHTVGGGLLRVEREGGNENYEAQVLSSPGASLVEFEGRRYLVLQSTVTSASVRALFSFWDFDDPCRQLPVKSDDASSTTTTTPTTSSPQEAPVPSAGEAAPVSASADYTG
ncbi:MAG: hypothetical protein GX643_05075 [Acidimicrobiales bacterium]|nr:hypothetical protein [Acidimicrobiales bacterium]